ncbi:hypothetical protein OESDEN_16462 [Oesophagostomum dentatum]|uniref:DUF4440 domain-containing protein n=1 Tax=Oesophagostomum dentatum TaxID=61180 RepID=A0A0B1SFX6_OESDE|nr:hypothetical protein OESDEN_16462 [Oesophagostomum dentatum]
MHKMMEEYGKVKFQRSNECYCGCEGCICAAYDVCFDSEKKGKVHGKVFQVWKKEGEKWKLYHDEYDISK